MIGNHVRPRQRPVHTTTILMGIKRRKAAARVHPLQSDQYQFHRQR